jgi:predicted nucleic acid-binding protein
MAKPDIVRLSHEILTRNWWTRRDRFELVTSGQVRLEASAGDSVAAAERLKALEGMPILSLTAESVHLAEKLAQSLKLPARARADAFHIAICAVHAVDFLLTWNCRHLANAVLANKIEETCGDAGFVPPRIVTPELLMDQP